MWRGAWRALWNLLLSITTIEAKLTWLSLYVCFQWVWHQRFFFSSSVTLGPWLFHSSWSRSMSKFREVCSSQYTSSVSITGFRPCWYVALSADLFHLHSELQSGLSGTEAALNHGQDHGPWTALWFSCPHLCDQKHEGITHEMVTESDVLPTLGRLFPWAG